MSCIPAGGLFPGAPYAGNTSVKSHQEGTSEGCIQHADGLVESSCLWKAS